ncbi:hypothetical protein ACIBEJ_35755 [Nonomuraea sp. NPDC050790]|uniref:hypothetical protein n=1 Tax=Nonomuraea sp. NPDC050790 TaxID=3364371 RepID=UPI0037B59009
MAVRSPVSAVISMMMALGLGTVSGCGHADRPGGRPPGTAALSFLPEVAVPDLVGRHLDAAQREAQGLGLVLSPKGISPLSVCRPDELCRIFAVRPAAGTRLAWGAEVEVSFLTAAESRFYQTHSRMPRVVGRSGAWAAVVFRPVMGLVDVITQPERGLLRGTDRVLVQSPQPGAPLVIGQPVKLTVGENRGTRPCGVRWWC